MSTCFAKQHIITENCWANAADYSQENGKAVHRLSSKEALTLLTSCHSDEYAQALEATSHQSCHEVTPGVPTLLQCTLDRVDPPSGQIAWLQQPGILQSWQEGINLLHGPSVQIGRASC